MKLKRFERRCGGVDGGQTRAEKGQWAILVHCRLANNCKKVGGGIQFEGCSRGNQFLPPNWLHRINLSLKWLLVWWYVSVPPTPVLRLHCPPAAATLIHNSNSAKNSSWQDNNQYLCRDDSNVGIHLSMCPIKQHAHHCSGCRCFWRGRRWIGRIIVIGEQAQERSGCGCEKMEEGRG